MILIKESEDPLNILFSCRILALSTFRIPTFGDIIMTAISDLQPPVESDIPDMRYDVLNQYEGDESSDESDSVTTESYTGSFSFSYGNSCTSHALSVEESSESSYESDSSETTSSSSSSHESSQDPPTMLLRFETDPSIHETSFMGPSELMDSLRNQQDGLPYDVPPEPNLYPDSPKLPPLRVIDYSRGIVFRHTSFGFPRGTFRIRVALPFSLFLVRGFRIQHSRGKPRFLAGVFFRASDVADAFHRLLERPLPPLRDNRGTPYLFFPPFTSHAFFRGSRFFQPVARVRAGVTVDVGRALQQRGAASCGVGIGGIFGVGVMGERAIFGG